MSAHGTETGLQSGTARTDVDMRSRCRACNRSAKREIRHVQPVEQSKQPDAFRLSGTECHINSILVVQPQGLVGQSLPESADGQRAMKLLLELRLNRSQIAERE